jgi:hypothetical protein
MAFIICSRMEIPASGHFKMNSTGDNTCEMKDSQEIPMSFMGSGKFQMLNYEVPTEKGTAKVV